MKSGIAFLSGGKDSVLSMHLAHNQGVKITGIMTMIPEDQESMLYHTHNINLVKTIAEVTGLNWIPISASKDREIEALTEALSKQRSEYLITGGIESNFQKKKFDNACKETGMEHYAPIWGITHENLYQKILENKLDVIIVSVAALGLGEEWLGRHLDKKSIEELLGLAKKYRFNAVGEGGDLDTLVLDGPLYANKLEPIESKRIWYGDRGTLEIPELRIIEK